MKTLLAVARRWRRADALFVSTLWLRPPSRSPAVSAQERSGRYRAWQVVAIGVSATGVIGYAALVETVPGDVLYGVIAGLCAAALGLGFMLHRPARGWLLLLGALLCWAFGDLLWRLQVGVGPVPAEGVLYLAGYPLLLIGALLLTTRGRLGFVRGALDSVFVGVSGGLLLWASLHGPLVDASGYLEVLYPVFDLMVLTALGQGLSTAARPGVTSVRLVFAGALVTFAADLVHAVEVMQGTALLAPQFLKPLWLVGYILFAWAGLHPSVRAVRPADEERSTTIGRQITLGLACLGGPTALVIHASHHSQRLELFAVTGMALTVVIFLRMLLLFRKQRLGETAMAAVFEHSLDGMLVADDDRVYVEANEAACRILGRSREQIVGKRMEEILGGDPASVASSWRTFREAGELRGVWPVYLGDGREIRLDFVARADYIPGRHLSIVRDVTEQHELEERLRQSQKLEAIGQLAGGVAHDFNNLLTAIGGYSQLALSDLETGNPRASSRIREIQRATGRAAELTKQLLAFGRRQILQPETFDLNGAVAETDSMLRRLLGEHIRIVSSLDPAGCRITADPGQVEQILVNLAVNARDAMPNGGTLVIETETEAKRVVLRVTDTGIGMNAATRERAFEPFYTTKPVGEGTGLGLATVHGIVHQSGGTITVSSEPGVGTTFEIAFPRSTAVPSADPETGEAESAGTELILLVEDEPVVRELACEMLEAQGYEVLTAADPDEALGLTGLDRIDALVTDVVMPKMSGRDLARRLREAHPDLPVVYVSGYSTDAALRDGDLEAGAVFLQKPFGSSELGRVVREVLTPAAKPT